MRARAHAGESDKLTARVHDILPVSASLFFCEVGAFTVMQHRLWHRRQRKQRRGCIGIDKVGPQSKKREVVDGWCPRHRNHSTQREGETQERICVSTLQKCHVSTESMFKEGWLIYFSLRQYSYILQIFFYDAVLMTFFFSFTDWEILSAVNQHVFFSR